MTRMDTCTPTPANYYVLQLRRAALLVGASRTACLTCRGPLRLDYLPLNAEKAVLQEIQLELEGGHLVFVAVFPVKGNYPRLTISGTTTPDNPQEA